MASRLWMVGVLAVASLAGCTAPHADVPALTDSPTATSAPASASPSAAVAFTGDLLTLVAAAPPHELVVTPAGPADLAATATAQYLAGMPNAADELSALGFRRGAVIGWQLSQLNYLQVTLFQLADESSARQWVTQQRQRWSGQPRDDQAFATLGLGTDFANGAQGVWLVEPLINSDETGKVRKMSAAFYRHEIVAVLSFTGTKDANAPLVQRSRMSSSRSLLCSDRLDRLTSGGPAEVAPRRNSSSEPSVTAWISARSMLYSFRSRVVRFAAKSYSRSRPRQGRSAPRRFAIGSGDP